MKLPTEKSGKGFIALMSAIIISAILLLVVVTAGLNGFYERSNILDAEFKERSVALADACVDWTLYQIAIDPNYAGNVPITVSGTDKCDIGVVQNGPLVGQKTFKTQAIFQNSYTNLEITINTADISIDSWKEIPTF